MAADHPPIEHRPGPTLPNILFWAALLSTLPVFWLVVAPAFGMAARTTHDGHYGWMLLHAFCGAVTVLSGFAGLYIGWTRRGFDWHRHIGCTYIGFGATMALASLYMSLPGRHGSQVLALSTATLSVAWLIAAGMGWRAGANRRFQQHRDWMIRSMVLTWTFVFCRLVQRTDLLAWVGDEAAAAGVWLYWVGPLVIAELMLQWPRGRRLA